MLNPFFLNGSQTEQNLVQSLVNEQLRMYGIEVYYLPRRYVTTNTVIKEVIQSDFTNAYPIEAYVDNYDGYTGQGSILSKFGIENRDDLQLIISKERYENYITPLIKDIPDIELSTRPKEGDLIYFPQRDACFQIMFVDKRQLFYPLGTLYLYKMVVELFEYSGERFSTGIESLDALEQLYSPDLTLWAIHNEDGDYWIDESNNIIVSERYGNTQPEPWTDNEVIQDEANDHVVQSDDDPWTWGKA